MVMVLLPLLVLMKPGDARNIAHTGRPQLSVKRRELPVTASLSRFCSPSTGPCQVLWQLLSTWEVGMILATEDQDISRRPSGSYSLSRRNEASLQSLGWKLRDFLGKH